MKAFLLIRFRGGRGPEDWELAFVEHKEMASPSDMVENYFQVLFV